MVQGRSIVDSRAIHDERGQASNDFSSVPVP